MRIKKQYWEVSGFIWDQGLLMAIFSTGQSGDAFTVTDDYGSMVNYTGPVFKNDESWEVKYSIIHPSIIRWKQLLFLAIRRGKYQTEPSFGFNNYECKPT
ncbi:MAG: hypothetical protein ISQ73_04625 [Verrucomicrobiae bacterium]|nr:hypothetical protein [Verrucomicrobiae bacterium]HBP55522.1 hypothetical protein [Verrucomicrobiales bacterium]HCZ02871.1 hypothetical protein [Verrucomicrobiales bacterium]|tara:strand:+ start:1381 stop:1680 length:300 start_codon:yes stop_codon:yes gene_type:complete